MHIGILHPGTMGVSIAASALNSGHTVFWASENRSSETRARAERHHLQDLTTLAELCARSETLVCVCPPHAAEEVARSVAEQSFSGIYLDANAISPQRAIRISEMLSKAGSSFVDGSIIGGPAWEPHSTWLYLSGPLAAEVAVCFDAGPLETELIGDRIGAASALKMTYAAYTKGSTALLSAILATAEALNVRDELEKQWSRGDPEFVERITRQVQRGTSKAWRFTGEMDEIAATFEGAGLPGEFHLAAAEIYRRLSGFKSIPEPALEEILEALLNPQAKNL